MQLLASGIDELAKHLALTAAPCRGFAALGARPLSPQYQLSLIVVGTAVAVSCLVEALFLSAYAKVVAAAAQGANRKMEHVETS